MPYTNVPEEMWGKMDRCVESVTADGTDKEAAIAMCHDSIVNGKDCPACPGGKAKRKARVKLNSTQLRKALAEDADLDVTLEDVDGQIEEAPETPGTLRRKLLEIGAGIKALFTPEPEPPTLPDLCVKARETGGAFVVRKDKAGQYRWLGVYSNNFKDLQGEIITEAAHAEFMAYLDANPDKAPRWWTWHEDIGRKSRADAWGVTDGFTFISGPASEQEAAPYLTLDKPRGMSHRFMATKEGKNIVQYRTDEVSDLPPEAAANPWTDFVVQEDSSMAFSPEKRKDFVGLFGEELTAQLEARAAEQAKALAEAGVQRKENEQTTEPAAPEAAAVETAAQDAAPAQGEQNPQAPDDSAAKALADMITGMAEQVKELTAEVATLKSDRKAEIDAAIAEALTPRVTPAQAGVKASTASETATDEAATIAQKERGAEWLRIGPVGH